MWKLLKKVYLKTVNYNSLYQISYGILNRIDQAAQKGVTLKDYNNFARDERQRNGNN